MAEFKYVKKFSTSVITPKARERFPAPSLRNNMPKQCDAFISYAREDSSFAETLQNNLEKRFKKVHKKFRGERDKLEVIRDVTDLDTQPDLWCEIQKKLERSNFLIVICSPASANRSQWVGREIQFFRTSRATQSEHTNAGIIPLLYRAEPQQIDNAFPVALKVENELPFALEFRREIIEQSTKYENYLAKDGLDHIYARLLGIEYRDFAERQKSYRERQQRFSLSIALGIAAFFAALALYSFIQRGIAIDQTKAADSRRLAVLSDTRLERNLEEAILLAVDAYEIKPTLEARQAIWNASQRYAWLDTMNHLPSKSRVLSLEPLYESMVAVGTDAGIFLTQPNAPPELVKFSKRLSPLALAFFPQDTRLAAAGSEGNVFVFDLHSSGPPLELSGGELEAGSSVFDVAVAKGGQYLAGTTNGGTLLAWDTDGKVLIDKISVPQSTSNQHHMLSSLWFDPLDEKELFFTINEKAYRRNVLEQVTRHLPLGHDVVIEGIIAKKDCRVTGVEPR